MSKYHPKPKCLSHSSSVIEVLLTFIQVLVDDTDGWDNLENKWIDTKLSNIPLFADVVDPTVLTIRGGNNGGPAPRGIPAALSAFPTGGNPSDGSLSQVPVFPIQRPVAVGAAVERPEIRFQIYINLRIGRMQALPVLV